MISIQMAEIILKSQKMKSEITKFFAYYDKKPDEHYDKMSPE